MGYNYLVKIQKNKDLYLLVDGRNDSLCFLGTRHEFETHDYWAQYMGTEWFERADEQGSTDRRMFWENSTYIDFDSHAVTRKTLAEFVEILDDNCNIPRGVTTDLCMSNRSNALFGGIRYPELVLGSESVGIDRETLDSFIRSTAPANRENSYLGMDGTALFKSAAKFAGNSDAQDILGWAATLSSAAANEDRQFRDLIMAREGRILSSFYSDFANHGWRDIFRLVAALGDDTSAITSFMDDAEEYPLETIISMVEAGHTKPHMVRRMLKNGIDSELAASIH